MKTNRKRLNRKFTPEEDEKLKKLVNSFGDSAWDEISSMMPGRNPRQCHDRYTYYLSPFINNSPFTEEEDKRIIRLQPIYNGRWVSMAKKFKGRTEVQLKNRWNTLRKLQNRSEKQYSPPVEKAYTNDISGETSQLNEKEVNLFSELFAPTHLTFWVPDEQNDLFYN